MLTPRQAIRVRTRLAQIYGRAEALSPGINGWLQPNGLVIEIGEIDHHEAAVKALRRARVKIIGDGASDLLDSGYIRLRTEGDELAMHTRVMPSRLQLLAIGEYWRMVGQPEVYYTIERPGDLKPTDGGPASLPDWRRAIDSVYLGRASLPPSLPASCLPG